MLNNDPSIWLEDRVHHDLVITDGVLTVTGRNYSVSNQTVLITNDIIDKEKFELYQSLNSDFQLKFGSCESASIKFNLHENLITVKDKVLKVYIIPDSDASQIVQIGVFKVYSDTLNGDSIARQIVAYDAMYDILNADVIGWYNGFFASSGAKTIATMRASLLSFFGITAETTTLVNDSMVVTKTVSADSLSGADVIRAICEVNGCFGTITNEGKFRFVELSPGIDNGLFPADDLYPANDLYPQDVNSDVTQIPKNHYYDPHFEDYNAEAITKLTIKNGGTGSMSVGTDGNTYIIEDNFLLYDKSGSQLTTIATNTLSRMVNRYYKPCSLKCIGNPCHEVGDPVRINTIYRGVVTYILERKLIGIQALKDEYTARGVKKYEENVNGISSQIKRMNGTVASLQVETDRIESSVENLDSRTSSSISQLSSEISAKVSSTGGSASTFGWSLTNSGFQLQSNGHTVFDCTASGTLFTSTDGSDNVEISDGKIYLEKSGMETMLSNGTIEIGRGTQQAWLGFITVGSVTEPRLFLQNGAAQTIITASGGTIGGNTIITSANIGSQSVSYSSSSYSADYSNRLMDVNNSFGCRPSTWSSQACVIPYRDSGSDGDVNLGWSSRRWKDIYATNGTIQTSDARQKKNIAELTEAHIRFIKAIVPRSFQFVAGESGRTHIGFVAQEIESAMTECGLTDLDFAGFIKSPVVALDEEGNPTDEIIDYIYGLRYEEFIALLVYGWQHTEARLDSLIERLENKGII